MGEIKPGRFFKYKTQTYRVVKVHQDKQSQNPTTGAWEATVEYSAEELEGVTFFRTISEFKDKFKPYV